MTALVPLLVAIPLIVAALLVAAAQRIHPLAANVTAAAVAATVTVLGPEKSKPLRVYRRRLKEAFSPGDRHELRIPIGAEWATERNSFVVAVRPAQN